MRFSTRHLLLLILCVSVSLASWIAGRKSAKTIERVQVTRLPCDDPLCEVAPGDISFVAKTFQADLEGLVKDAQIATAVWLLIQASPDELIKEHGTSYCAVGDSYFVSVPGTDAEFDETRDIILPHLGKAPFSSTWRNLCSLFAERYNERVDEIGKGQQE